MIIEVNTDRNIEGSERLIDYCTSTLEVLDCFSETLPVLTCILTMKMVRRVAMMISAALLKQD
ncbi:MAG: hypothetical protein U5K54_11320 [Cytophagales bacterium]|nr:hypothetical protein [Cytophagales bacterium]